MWVVLWEFRVRYDYNLLGQLEKSSESTQAFLGLQNSVLKGRLRQGPQEGWSQRRRRNSTWMMATVKKTDNTGKRGVWWTEIKKKHLQSMSTWVLRESGGCLTQGRTAKIQTVLEVRRKTGEKTWINKQLAQQHLRSVGSKRAVWGGPEAMLATFSPSGQFSLPWFHSPGPPDRPHPPGRWGTVPPTAEIPPSSSGSCVPAHTPSLQSGWQPVGQFASSHTPLALPYLSSASWQFRGPLHLES